MALMSTGREPTSLRTMKLPSTTHGMSLSRAPRHLSSSLSSIWRQSADDGDAPTRFRWALEVDEEELPAAMNLAQLCHLGRARVLRQVVLPLLGAPQVNAEQRERRPLARHLDFVGQVLRPTHTEREGGRLGDVVALAPGRGAARGQAELDL
eukprot:scaffold6057_cov112-Isochrysis_galbana.AAC.3